MKNIVTVKRDIDGRTRIYEIPEEWKLDLEAGTKVMVEYRDGTTAATTTQNSIEVEDSIVAYFTPRPLRKIESVIIKTDDAENDAQDAEN